MSEALESIERIFDSYNRQARLYPAFLVALPIFVSSAVLWHHWIASDALKPIAAALGGSGLLYLLSSVARARGKRVEPELLKKWDGWPTTRILRFRDLSIDRHTKLRYHAALALLCSDLTMPDESYEQKAPQEADLIYRSATKRLVEHRRGQEYRLLHAENAHYGFWRNMFGCRSLGIIISIIAAFIVAEYYLMTLIGVASASGLELNDSVLYVAGIAFDTMCALGWILTVREQAVELASRSYAEALFRSLDFPTT